MSLMPGQIRKIPGVGNGNPLQYSCLQSPMDRGAWWATVHGDLESRTRLSAAHTPTLSVLDTHCSVPHILHLHSAQQLPPAHEHRCQKDVFSLQVTLLGTRCENYRNVSISLVSLGPSVKASQVVPSPLTWVDMEPPGGAGGLHQRS